MSLHLDGPTTESTHEINCGVSNSIKFLRKNAVESQLHTVFLVFHSLLGMTWDSATATGPPLGWSTVVSVSMSTAKAEPKVLQPGYTAPIQWMRTPCSPLLNDQKLWRLALPLLRAGYVLLKSSCFAACQSCHILPKNNEGEPSKNLRYVILCDDM